MPFSILANPLVFLTNETASNWPVVFGTIVAVESPVAPKINPVAVLVGKAFNFKFALSQ